MTEHKETGTLFLTATPIGNLDDITIRALDILKKVDIVAAEDTRRTRKLLSFYDIHKPLISFREHNKIYQGQKIIGMLKEGKNVALCSDAGMPVISDPGEDFIRLCIDEDIPFTIIPGANAAISALVLSGFSANTFLYLGFIPRKKKKKREFLENISKEPHTLIFYESPKRVVPLLEAVYEVMGDRRVCVVRELTKIHEEAIRGETTQIIGELKDRELRGEFTIIIEGFVEEENDGDYLDVTEIVSEVEKLTSEGMSKNDAFKKIAPKYHTSKRAIYSIYLTYQEKK
ncbi:MAG: 16S rRNA (cytidine(1402)-2'-O)-methyltransferase [Candidatus Eremiobacteraeota bacterium]|nr:16S rRNA (cytidine(1402)-2'-O)-methyltransferase [Candidatus Eremiobacteraeota bacterium]